MALHCFDLQKVLHLKARARNLLMIRVEGSSESLVMRRCSGKGGEEVSDLVGMGEN